MSKQRRKPSAKIDQRKKPCLPAREDIWKSQQARGFSYLSPGCYQRVRTAAE